MTMGIAELAPPASVLLELYERMLLIRRTEERLSAESTAGSLPGAVHLYIGEEAVAVGVSAQLSDRDYATSTHRGHGHFLASDRAGNVTGADFVIDGGLLTTL